MVRRLLVSLTVCAIAIAGAAASPRAQQLTTKRVLTLEAAKVMAAAAEAEARKNNWNIAIAVLDDGGHLLFFQRMDGAKLVAIDIAIRKARTAVHFQGPTKGLEDEVTKDGRTALLPIDGFMPLEGGIPVVVDGKVIGAIGASGVTGAQDAQCAQAGLNALKPK